MITTIQRLGRIFLFAFAIVALTLGYWGLLRRDELLARQDNPRTLLIEQGIRRGRILDRNNVVLAETHIDPTTGLGTRDYPEPAVAPVVGYYSLRHGVGGIEAAYDDTLRGDAYLTPTQRFTNQLLHRPQIGHDVRLTIDLATQQAAEQMLEAKTGTIIVIMVPQGDVLAIGSQPSFDPNKLDDLWDSLKSDPSAPLLTRATQSLYQPGTVLNSIILGTAINVEAATPDEEWNDELVVSLGSARLPCSGNPPISIDSLHDAFLWSCPRPFQILGQDLGAHILEGSLYDFGLLEMPAFELPTATVPLDDGVTQSNLSLASVGQGDLTVSALQMALVAAAFADHGQMPAPRLVQAIYTPENKWEPTPLLGTPRGTISRVGAERVAQLMADTVISGAAQPARQVDLTVYGQVGLALSGPKDAFNSWFIGFAYRENGEAVAVAVLIENSNSVDDAAYIGGKVLDTALRNLQ